MQRDLIKQVQKGKQVLKNSRRGFRTRELNQLRALYMALPQGDKLYYTLDAALNFGVAVGYAQAMSDMKKRG